MFGKKNNTKIKEKTTKEHEEGCKLEIVRTKTGTRIFQHNRYLVEEFIIQDYQRRIDFVLDYLAGK